MIRHPAWLQFLFFSGLALHPTLVFLFFVLIEKCDEESWILIAMNVTHLVSSFITNSSTCEWIKIFIKIILSACRHMLHRVSDVHQHHISSRLQHELVLLDHPLCLYAALRRRRTTFTPVTRTLMTRNRRSSTSRSDRSPAAIAAALLPPRKSWRPP